MFTLVGWTESQDSAVLVNVAALAAPHIRVNLDDVIIPSEVPLLVATYALGPNLTRAQLVSPSLRRLLNYEISPVEIAAEPLSPTAWVDMRDHPIPLDPEEALNAQAAEDGAGATRATILAWLADKAITPIVGDIRSTRVTNATTLVANAWTNGALTFADQLPAGRYACVGARFFGAGLQAFRMLFVGYTWRPGAIGFDTAADVDPFEFRCGRFGVWGEFNHNTPPTVDFLSNSADTSQIGVLDLIKLA